jgi:hypothetical protein
VTLDLSTDELAVLVACVSIATNKRPLGEHVRTLARSPPAVTDAVVDKLAIQMRLEAMRRLSVPPL